VRRTLAIAAVFACAAVAGTAAAPAAGAGRGLQVTEGQAAFPERAYMISLPGLATLSPDDLRVRENGGRVSSVSLVPAYAAGTNALGVVLVIDASNSMQHPDGKPIVDAMDAARAFAAQLQPNQQLAIVTFNDKATVTLPFTADAAKIRAALASAPPLAQETHVHDAVAGALALAGRSSLFSTSIVVLSDGADTGSRARLDDVIARARAARIRVFSVGLRSKEFQRRPLERLAVEARGRYSEATSSAELAGIYAELGSDLANEYVVRYLSVARPAREVKVEISVAGYGTVRTGYVSPALSVPPRPSPYHSRSAAAAFWRSTLAMIVVSLVAAFLLAVGAALALQPRNRTLRKRLSEFVSVPAPVGKEGPAAVLTERVFTGTERSLAQTRWWGRFKEELLLAEIKLGAVQIVLGTFVLTVAAMFVARVVGGSPAFALVGLVVPLVVRWTIKAKLKRRRNAFAEQLPDNLQVLASALRAGHSFVGALSVVVEDAAEPSRSEFRRVVADDQLGVPIEDAIDVVVRRMDCRELEQVALVAALGRETGGNSAEVLDTVTQTIRERFELRRLIMTLTAQGRLARWVVSALPVGLLAAITALNPTYMEPLYNETIGRVLMVFAGVLVVLGSLVIRKIIDIKV
jgi:tight adherence protein B